MTNCVNCNKKRYNKCICDGEVNYITQNYKWENEREAELKEFEEENGK